MADKEAVVVLPYGYIQGRPWQELSGYHNYLRHVAASIVARGKTVKYVVVPGVEAWEVIEYLKSLLDKLVTDRIEWIVEGRPLTTPAGIYWGYQTLKQILGEHIEAYHFTFVCDLARRSKVEWMRLILLPELDQRSTVLAFKRPDPNWRNCWLVQEAELFLMKLYPTLLIERRDMLQQ